MAVKNRVTNNPFIAGIFAVGIVSIIVAIFTSLGGAGWWAELFLHVGIAGLLVGMLAAAIVWKPSN